MPDIPLTTHCGHWAEPGLFSPQATVVSHASRGGFAMPGITADHVDERRPMWRVQWLSTIHEFSDQETQRRHWLNLGDGSEMSSFDELYCVYFDDLGFWRGAAVLVEEGYLSAGEAAAVEPLHAAAERYSRAGQSDEEIIADPKWAEVVAAAKCARAALLVLLSSPNELEALQNG
jgi:hypothetical protein